MRVLAAAFENPAAARATLDELRRRYDLRPGDASMAPLGTGGRPSSQTVIAGRFMDSAVPEIRVFVAAAGGRVVSDVDERWTRPVTAHESLEPEDSLRH